MFSTTMEVAFLHQTGRGWTPILRLDGREVYRGFCMPTQAGASGWMSRIIANFDERRTESERK